MLSLVRRTWSYRQFSSVYHHHARWMSSESDGLKKEPRVTLTDDGQTVVCWHPPEPFPYEHSLPYVEASEQDNKESVLTLEAKVKGENLYQKTVNQRLVLEEVQALTFTPKHVWRRRRYDGLQMRPKHPRKGV